MRTVMLSARVAAVVAAAALVGATATASASRVEPAGGPGHWSQVTPGGSDTIQDIGLATGNRGALNVIWASGETSAGHARIWDTPISPAGAVGHAATVIAGQFLVTYPDATATKNRIVVVWNGIEKNPGPDGTFIASRAIAGGAWSAPANLKPLGSYPFTTGSVAATTGADGKPWFAYYGTGSLVVGHIGQPAEHQIAPAGCCYYNPGLAVDGKTGSTWIAYESLIPRHEGIYAQLLASSGKPVGAHDLMPGSEEKGSAAVVSQRIGVTGRGHGRSGVYAAYVAGYPFGLRVDLLKLGTRRLVTLARTSDARQFAGATVTADPAGGLWVAWYEGDGSPAALFVRQSSNSVAK